MAQRLFRKVNQREAVKTATTGVNMNCYTLKIGDYVWLPARTDEYPVLSEGVYRVIKTISHSFLVTKTGVTERTISNSSPNAKRARLATDKEILEARLKGDV